MRNLSNYPPGVTGNEYEIAGPDREWEDPAHSDCRVGCGVEGQEAHWETYQGQTWWVCPSCNTSNTVDAWDDYEG